MWKYLYVFDYCVCGIYQIKVPNTEEDIDVAELLEQHGFKEDQCAYMFSNDELCVQFAEKVN